MIKSDEVLIPSNHLYSLFLGNEVLILNDHFLVFNDFLSVITSDEVLIPGQLPYSLVSW